MYADWGGREKAGDERRLPSTVFLSGQQRAQLAANRQRVIVRSLVTDHAVTGQIGTIVVSAGFPAAPFAIAPAAGSNIRLLWAVIEQQHDKWNTCHLTQNTKCGGAWIWPPPYFYVICAFKSGAACYLGFMCFHRQTYLLHISNRSRQIAFMCLLFFQKLSGGFFDVMAHTKNSDAKQHS